MNRCVGIGCAQPQAVALINRNWCDFISSLTQFEWLQYGGVFIVPNGQLNQDSLP